MQSIRETTPPLYFHLVSEISKKGLGDNKFLEETLNQVHPLSSVATWISAIMTNENNEIGKRDLFTILLRSLSSAEEIDDGFNDDLIIQLVSKIAGFPFPYRDEDFYNLMRKSLLNLYNKLSAEGINKLQTSIPLSSTYASYVFALLAIDHETKVPAILGGPPNTIPTFEGLILFMSEKEYSQLDSDSQTAITRSNLTQVITQQASSFSEAAKAYGLRLLLAYFHFNAEEAMKICPPVVALLGYLKKDLLKSTTIKILSQPCFSEKIKGTETKVAIAIASQVTNAGEYAHEATQFIINNETMSAASNDYIQQLLRVEQYALAGCIVAHEKGLFESQPDLVQTAFPNPVKRMRIAIELSKCIQKPTQPLYEAMLNQAFVAYATAHETDGIKNFIELAATSGYSECFANFLLKRLVEVTSQKVFNVLGEEIKASLINKENAIQRVAPSEPELFYKLICHLYGQCESHQNALNILSLYKDVPTDLLKSVGPIGPINYISAVIPESEYPAFLEVAQICAQQYPSVVNLCICLPNLDGDVIGKLVLRLQNDNTFTLDIALVFYAYFANNYQDHFFAYLEKEKIGKQVTNNIFVNKKKKARIDNTVRAVMRVLPKSIESKKQTFDEEGQKRLCSIICSILPRVNLQDFTDDIKGLGVLFNYIKDIAPQEDEYNLLVDTGFVEQYNIIFKNVTGHPELAKKLIENYINTLQDVDTFADKIYGTPEEKAAVISNIEETAKSLFALDPNEETLFFTLDTLVKKNLHPKRQRFIDIKYPIIIQKFAEAARSKDVGVTQPNFVSFITRLFAYANSRNPEVRVAVHIAFEKLFGVDHLENMTDKERTELFENQLDENSYQAENEEQEDETPKKISENPEEEEEVQPPVRQQNATSTSNKGEEGYHYTNDQIDESVVKLYEACQKNMSVEFVNQLLDFIIVKKIFTPSVVLFIRALFQAHENFASSDYSENILKLYLLQPQMTVQFQFDKGVYALAERSLTEFIAILLVSESPYQYVIIKNILSNANMRERFIDTLFTYINTLTNLDRTLNLSYILKAIIESEGCEIRPKSFAMLFSSILIWLGALYTQNLKGKVNLIKLNNQTSEISKIIDSITLRTCISAVFGVNIDVSVTHFAETHRALANLVVAIPADQLTILFAYINKVIDSANKAYVLSAGLFAIAMMQCHAFFSTHTQELIEKIIPATVVHSFEKVNDPIDIDTLCQQVDDTFVNHLTDDQIKTIYGILVKNIHNEEPIYYQEYVVVLLNSLAKKLHGDELLPDDLLLVLRYFFQYCLCDSETLELLQQYLSVRCDIEDFSMDNQYMNIEQLFNMIPSTNKKSLDVLRKISNSDDIISGIIGKAKVDETVLARCGVDVVKYIAYMNADEYLIKLATQILKIVMNIENEEVQHYKERLLDLFISEGEYLDGEFKEELANALKLLLA